MQRIAKLALEDGSVWTGRAFGAEGETSGEICFNTSMIGYQEIMTDPGSAGLMVVMSYTEIGNYGANSEDLESGAIHLSGLVVRNLSSRTSNFRNESDLDSYLRRFGKIGISEIDTRALIRRLRNSGTQKAILSTVDLDDSSLVSKAKSAPGLIGRDLVKDVVTEMPYDWDEPLSKWLDLATRPESRPVSSVNGCNCDNPNAKNSPLVVVLDYGLKWSFSRQLFDMGCRVKVVPGTKVTAETIMKYNPAGIFLSNGPGDPDALPYLLDTVRGLLGKAPIFAVGVGMQILAAATGAKSYKLKLGHHGSNQPVQDTKSGRVEITSQNHDFAIDPDSLGEKWTVTHTNLHDGTVEGIRHNEFPAFGLQYYPEPSAGPVDSVSVFETFWDMLKK